MNAEQPDPPADNAEHQQRRARAELVDQLFREHNEALIRFLRTRLRSHQEAKEVAQEAYVRLLSLDEPNAVSYLRAFLFKTATNLAVDRMRRDELHTRATSLPLFSELADMLTPERRISAEQTVQRLERLIAAMPAKSRQAFILKRFDGMDLASIARELRLSKRTVREYVARALLQCRACLDLEQNIHQESDNDTGN